MYQLRFPLITAMDHSLKPCREKLIKIFDELTKDQVKRAKVELREQIPKGILEEANCSVDIVDLISEHIPPDDIKPTVFRVLKEIPRKDLVYNVYKDFFPEQLAEETHTGSQKGGSTGKSGDELPSPKKVRREVIPSENVTSHSEGQIYESPSESKHEYMYDHHPADPVINAANHCERELRDIYSRKCSVVNPLPWCKTSLQLKSIYTEVELQLERVGRSQTFQREKLFSASEEDEDPRRILLLGDLGYGKSTFCSMLAYDWAKREAGFLKRFKLLFFLRPHELKGSLVDSMFDAWFSEDTRVDRKYLKEYVQKNQEKVAIVVDGWGDIMRQPAVEEKEIVKIVRGWLLRSCKVMVTSRGMGENESSEYFDRKLSINGFTENTFKAYIHNHFKATNEINKTEMFLNDIEHTKDKTVLFELMKCPLLSMILCDIMIKDGVKPSEIRRVCEQMTDVIVRRYRYPQEKVTTSDTSEDDIDRQLNYIGKLSTEFHSSEDPGLTESALRQERNPAIKEIGFLCRYSAPQRGMTHENPPHFQIKHETFKHFFVAKHLASSLCEDETFREMFKSQFENVMSSYQDNAPLDLRLLFGMLKEKSPAAFKCLGELGWVSNLNVVLDCLEETQKTDALVLDAASVFNKKNTMYGVLNIDNAKICQKVIAQSDFDSQKTLNIKVSLSRVCEIKLFNEIFQELSRQFPSSEMSLTIFCTDRYSCLERLLTTKHMKTLFTVIKEGKCEHMIDTFSIHSFPAIAHDAIGELLKHSIKRFPKRKKISIVLDCSMTCVSPADYNQTDAIEVIPYTHDSEGGTIAEDENPEKSEIDLSWVNKSMFTVIKFSRCAITNLIPYLKSLFSGRNMALEIDKCDLNMAEYINLSKTIADFGLMTLVLANPSGTDSLSLQQFTRFVGNVSSMKDLRNLQIVKWRFSPADNDRRAWIDQWIILFESGPFITVKLCLSLRQLTDARETHPMVAALVEIQDDGPKDLRVDIDEPDLNKAEIVELKSARLAEKVKLLREDKS